MEDVTDRAAALCWCKLLASLLFLPWLTSSRSPIAFCCCCLLIFTDLLFAVFLSFLWVLESLQWALAPLCDALSLRFLLFLGNTYGTVLLLVTPLIAAESLTGPAWDGRRAEGEQAPAAGVGCLCCLSVWAVAALGVGKRTWPEEMRAVSCLQAGGSLLRCLPDLLSPMPCGLNPCWVLAFLVLLLVLLLLTSGLGLNRDAADVTVAAPPVDPGTTDGSCAVHTDGSQSGVQACRHGDAAPLAEQVAPTARRGTPDMLVSDPEAQRRGFPRPGLKALMGCLALVSVLVLPFYLSVNVVLLRTVETLLELLLRALRPPAADAQAPCGATLV